jgi:16S rRNA (guanine527-N7)-methyltransferase
MKQDSLTNPSIREVLLPYGIVADDNLCESIEIYVNTLLQWNAKIALTTITDPAEVLRVHFGESFFAAAAAQIEKGRLADIGTGAGFPGIPIRMVRHLIELKLVEPVAKKTAFLAEIGRKLHLERMEIIRCRMEDWRVGNGSLDFITSRALGNYGRLLAWSKTRLSQDGRAVLLIGEADVETIEGEPGWKWGEPSKVPQSRGKYVLFGSPSEGNRENPCYST